MNQERERPSPALFFLALPRPIEAPSNAFVGTQGRGFPFESLRLHFARIAIRLHPPFKK